MVTTFKASLNGFYCAECRMVFGEPHAACPYCGSIVSNYETLVSQKELSEIISEDTSTYEKVLKILKEQFQNESNIHGAD